MAVTASDVKALRDKSGAGMMECKKALDEANGSVDEAMKLLKERGLLVAAKKADRITAEGFVDILYDEDSNTAVMVEVNSETDFVGKNENFQAFVKGCLKVIMKEKPATVAELLTKEFGSGMTVDGALKDQVLQVKENISIRRMARSEGNLSTYIHNKGEIGVIVKVDADAAVLADGGFAEFKKNIALQIASMGADYIVREDVPASVMEEEKAAIIEKINEDEDNAKKPANVIEKMIEGKIRKFYEENCLLEQDYIKEDKLNVAQYIDGYKKQAGGEVKVAEFFRFKKGEGLQKREDNFADEIAQLTGQK